MGDRVAGFRDPDALADAPAPPEGAAEPRRPPIFVVQEHAASSHHWDVRLEVDGVLVSWAVPKGPSTDPRDHRLAVRTPDHELDYADYEGTIAADEYGGGRVIVWDLGPYRNLTTDDDGREVPTGEAIRAGHVKVWLAGRKLRGGWAFTRARLGGNEDNWLLTKVSDDRADARRNPVSTERESVLTGRTIDDLDEQEEGP